MSKYDRKLGDADSPNHELKIGLDHVTVWYDCQSVILTRQQVVTLVVQLIQDGFLRVEDLPTPYHCYSCDENACDSPGRAEHEEAEAKRRPYRRGT